MWPCHTRASLCISPDSQLWLCLVGLLKEGDYNYRRSWRQVSCFKFILKTKENWGRRCKICLLLIYEGFPRTQYFDNQEKNHYQKPSSSLNTNSQPLDLGKKKKDVLLRSPSPLHSFRAASANEEITQSQASKVSWLSILHQVVGQKGSLPKSTTKTPCKSNKTIKNSR